jgi:CheY-like chemotaxis protein
VDTRLPAIALTAYASETDREQALTAGYDLHLTKPVEPHELARAVTRVFQDEPERLKWAIVYKSRKVWLQSTLGQVALSS